MKCGGCDNIPFWTWVKVNQTFTTNITCNDFDGDHLSNLQPNNGTGCFGKYLCTWCWKCYQMYCIFITNIKKSWRCQRSSNSKDREHNDQQKKYRQRSTKHTENERSSNTSTIKTPWWTQALRISTQVLLHMWYLSCNSCYKSSDKSRMRKGKYKGYIPIHEATFILTNILPFHILSYMHTCIGKGT